ncbi:MAG: ParB/RepB/Spo0J family partition protein [candidate division Zixibacteria bacterium]
MKRPALGKGLDALIPGAASSHEDNDSSVDPGRKAIAEIPLEKIVPNPYQPRQAFNSAKLAELVESIKEQGVIQPIAVRPVDDSYEIIAGERRFRAVEKLGWNTIPSIVFDSTDNETAMELALIENLQREDLNPIEEATAYSRLMSECSLSQADVAVKVGKDRSSVANIVRLLSLSEEIQNLLIKGDITSGHARALLAVPTSSERDILAARIVKEGLSVRGLEKLVYSQKSARKSNRPKERPAQIISIEESLKRKLATRVILSQKRKGGKITIEYYSNDELNRLLEFFGVLENF